jgi:hypothetical protein
MSKFLPEINENSLPQNIFICDKEFFDNNGNINVEKVNQMRKQIIKDGKKKKSRSKKRSRNKK